LKDKTEENLFFQISDNEKTGCQKIILAALFCAQPYAEEVCHRSGAWDCTLIFGTNAAQ